jgi:hypothetical protein
MASYKHVSPSKKKEEPKFPSLYGSHSSMIDEEETKKLDDEKMVALRDEKGLYVTYKKRLDTKMADPSRYDSKRKKESTNSPI